MHTRTIALGAVLAAALSSATALASADAATSTHASPAARAGAYRVTATVNKTEPMLDSKVKIKGGVSPASPGDLVTLQVKYQDQKDWKTIDRQRLNAGSRFRFKDKVGSVRTRKYRVLKPAGPNRAAGRGTTEKVTVFGWRELTSLRPANASGFVESEDAVTMNGVDYRDSLRSYTPYPAGPSTIDYNLNRDCKTFRGVVGLDDSSPASGSAQIQLSTDGTVRYNGAFALTQAALVTFDLTKVFRLTVRADLFNGGVAGVGTPEVLCSF